MCRSTLAWIRKVVHGLKRRYFFTLNFCQLFLSHSYCLIARSWSSWVRLEKFLGKAVGYAEPTHQWLHSAAWKMASMLWLSPRLNCTTLNFSHLPEQKKQPSTQGVVLYSLCWELMSLQVAFNSLGLLLRAHGSPGFLWQDIHHGKSHSCKE